MKANTQTDVSHLCLQCQGEIPDWRRNKKFCDSTCKYKYHNALRTLTDVEVRRVNRILERNYEILNELIGNKKHVEVEKEKLAKTGFRFDFCTFALGTYKYCYHLSYRAVDNKTFLISRASESVLALQQ